MSGGIGNARRANKIGKCTERIMFNEALYMLYRNKDARVRLDDLVGEMKHLVESPSKMRFVEKIKESFNDLDDGSVGVSYLTKFFNRLAPNERVKALAILMVCYEANEDDIWKEEPEIQFDNHHYRHGGINFSLFSKYRHIADEVIPEKMTVAMLDRFKEYNIDDEVTEEVFDSVCPNILGKIEVKEE